MKYVKGTVLVILAIRLTLLHLSPLRVHEPTLGLSSLLERQVAPSGKL